MTFVGERFGDAADGADHQRGTNSYGLVGEHGSAFFHLGEREANTDDTLLLDQELERGVLLLESE